MARIKSARTQILGQLTAFLTALVKVVQELGGGEKDLELLGNPEQSGDLIRRIAELVVVEGRRQRGEGPIADWTRFYREVLGIEADLANVAIPADPGGFGWPVIVLGDMNMTMSRAWQECKARFTCWSSWGYNPNWDEVVPRNDRTSEQTYAVSFRDCVEADEELKSLSANQLAERRVKGITLLERMLLELWYHWKTGKHLDQDNWTLCSGSRSADGDVPFAFCDGSTFEVGWVGLDHRGGDLCSREAVSM